MGETDLPVKARAKEESGCDDGERGAGGGYICNGADANKHAVCDKGANEAQQEPQAGREEKHASEEGSDDDSSQSASSEEEELIL